MKILKKILTLITFLGIGVMLQAKDLKVMTYNIYGARLTNGDKLGEVIKKYNPDFIVLQEVDKNTIRSNKRDVTEDIVKKLGYDNYYFQKTLDFNGGEFGISIISKYPIERYYTFELPSVGNEKRHLLGAQISKDVFGKSITIINAHLNYQENIKAEETEEVLAVTDVFEGDVKFLAGDLNMLPTSESYPKYLKKWTDSYTEIKGSPSNSESEKDKQRNEKDTRIDYIFGDKSKNWKVNKSFFVKDESEKWDELSDHIPYMAEFEIKEK